MPTTPDPTCEADLKPRVQKFLDAWLSATRTQLLAIDPDFEGLLAAIGDLLRGGKRLRTSFCYWGWRGAAAEDDMRIIGVGAAIELVQAAALLHDDLIDASDTRRGLPAAHRRVERDHAERGWLGESAAFGEAAAILAGDLCLSASARLMHDMTDGLDPGFRTFGLQFYDDMNTELMAGQYLDMIVGARPNEIDPVEAARRVIRHKTVNYTVAKPLQIGGALAGATPQLMDAYLDYAGSVGEAFQLRDDVLGVFGDPATTGKPAGDDLREGKQTMLIALASQAATPAQREVLDQIGDPGITDDQLERLRTVITETGALGRVEAMIDDLGGRALETVQQAPITPLAGQALANLVTSATKRNT